MRFAVSDTGPGIPAQHIGRVFEPFFRVPDAGKPQGAGLGLAIVKEIVEAHGGTVAAESREGKGASINFSLRRADRPFGRGKRMTDLLYSRPSSLFSGCALYARAAKG